MAEEKNAVPVANEEKKPVQAVVADAGVLGIIKFMGGLPVLKAIVLTLVFLVSGIVWQQQERLVGMVAKAVEAHTKADIERVHSTALSDALIRSKQITAILAAARKDVGASRVTLLEFHNGQESLRGVPFLFMSATAETVNAGISSERNALQHVPIAVVMEWMTAFLQHKCVDQAIENAPAATAQEQEKHGTKRTIACPVFADARREPVGLVAVSYIQGWEPPGEDAELAGRAAAVRLKAAADLTGATLAAYLEQIGR